MRIKGFLAVFPILLFSALFGFFLWEIYFICNNPGYPPRWHGWWITSSQIEGDVLYFRKKFNLSDNIKNAWLIVSASDDFKVYLNGEAAGTEELDSWFPIGIYDVTQKINMGINVLAVRVEKRSFKEHTKAVVELGYEDTNGNEHYIFSDDTWKVSNREERDFPFGPLWNATGFNDSSWVNAEILEKPTGLWLNLDPRIYVNSADGQWFWAGDQKEISCRAEIYVPNEPKTAWIRLASRGGFRLLVNGRRVDIEEGTLGTTSISRDVLKIYEIGPFLGHGNNVITIDSYAESQERGLYTDGIIEGDGWSKRIDENDFKCSYPEGANTLLIYKGDPGWVNLKSKQIQDIYIPLGLSVLSYLRLVFIFCLVLVVLIGLTLIFSIMTGSSFYSLSGAYIIPFFFLIFIYILRYDTRFYLSFPFQRKFLIASLCLLFLIWLFNPLIDKIRIRELSKHASVIAFILIILVGAFIRFKGISQECLSPDEAGLVVTVDGILDRGYPSRKPAPELPATYVSTSELVFYLQSLSFMVFGKSEFSLRLPAVLAGVLTIFLLYYFGRMIGGQRLGLLASAVYALLPSAIGMSHWARYPSQLSFFGFLTGFLAFLYSQTCKARYLYLCALSFLLTYFSWQGSALMFPVLVLGCIMIWKRERILKDIIIFILIIGCVVGIHLSARFLEVVLVRNSLFGPSIAGLTPTLMILSPLYTPFYYIKNFFFIESHQFLSILFFAGLPLVIIRFRMYKSLLFLFLFPLIVPFIMSNLLEIADYRYAYYLLPYLVLSACGVLFILLDYLDKGNKSLKFINLVLASIVLISISSNVLLNLKNFPGITESIKTDPRLRYFPETYKEAEFVKANTEPGDVIISNQPHLLEYYLGKGKADYFFESRLALPVLITPRYSTFIPIHRVSGTPAFLSLNELKRVIGASEKRVWLVTSPNVPSFFDRDTQEFFNKNQKVMFERYQTTVYLIGGR